MPFMLTPVYDFEVQLQETGIDGWYYRSPSQYYWSLPLAKDFVSNQRYWIVYGTEFDFNCFKEALLNEKDSEGNKKYESVNELNKTEFLGLSSKKLGIFNYWDPQKELEKEMKGRPGLFNNTLLPITLVQSKFDKKGKSSENTLFRVKGMIIHATQFEVESE